MSEMTPPSSLLEAIRDDLRPVRPLLPTRIRIVGILIAAIAGAGLLFATFGIRHDLPEIPALAFWIPLALRIAAGTVLVIFAIREAVPSQGAPASARGVVVALALALLLVLPTAFADIVGGPSWSPPAEDFFCYRVQMLIAGPAFLLAWFLVARGFPLRPAFAMFAAGLGAGLLSDAALFAACSVHGQKHWLVAHSGAVLTYAMLGAAAGAITAALRRRKAAE